MNEAVGALERSTQNQVIEFFTGQRPEAGKPHAASGGLGWRYGGNWIDRKGNSNVDKSSLLAWLNKRCIPAKLATRALDQLLRTAALPAGGNLYDVNERVYSVLRYGTKVRVSANEPTQTVRLIDWEHPEANDFMIAEEVTIRGMHNKRPDLVLYVNGIALGVLELKRAKVGVSEGIRQNIGNQREDFIRPFFTTVQLIFAGNGTEGLRYGVIETREKYWLRWKETCDETNRSALDLDLEYMCSKERFLELIHDFVVFDAGVKKVARHNQYFAIKAAQKQIRKREGGIIWHSQGSGKTLTMVWLARWIHENMHDARVILVTDRTELDTQIERKFLGVREQIERARSGIDLLAKLAEASPWLICTLVHKFGNSNENDASSEGVTEFAKAIAEAQDFQPQGNLYVFVDEAHRTQSGLLHDAMKALLPGAMFIGFTGTPLLKKDKATTIEKFGSYIHTYKFDEAVEDGVVLDLLYEARSIEQTLTSPQKVDRWFEAKTRGLTDLTKATIKKRWGTLNKVVSAAPRAQKIVNDIALDMECEPRLASGEGNAMLVCASVYEACKIYEMFQDTDLREKCAIVTSYKPDASAISKEDSGEGATEELKKYNVYRQMIAKFYAIDEDDALRKVTQFEEDVKELFIDKPGQMKLLIVVDKLLTGFDAPSATYLYIDKKMRDHGLFQAICRVNRLDGEDKSYGYIIDYRDLFNSLEQSIFSYTGEAFADFDDADVEGLIKDRSEEERKHLENALERVHALVEPVKAPKDSLAYQHFFCAEHPGDISELKAREPRRVDLYKAVNMLVRAWSAASAHLDELGYSQEQINHLRGEVNLYVNVRDEIRLAAGENIDLKQYEAGMRQLLDRYIQAGESETLGELDKGLVQLIAEHGADAIGLLPRRPVRDPAATAATIANNVRKAIVDARALNPRYYDQMSELLQEIIRQHNEEATSYAEYLQQLIELASQTGRGPKSTDYPEWASTPGRGALVDLCWPPGFDVKTVFDFVQHEKEDRWMQNSLKERKLRHGLRQRFPQVLSDEKLMDELISLLKEHSEFR